MDKKQARDVGQVVRQVLQHEGLLDGLDFLNLKREWRQMLGPAAARECVSMTLTDGVFKVKVRSSVLRNQLNIQKPLLLARLNSRLPQPMARDLLIY